MLKPISKLNPSGICDEGARLVAEIQTETQAGRQVDFAAQAHSPENTGKAL